MGKQSRRPSRRTRNSRERTVNMTPETYDMLMEQVELFKKKFGREPHPDEPLFFDSNADTVRRMGEDEFLIGFLEESVEAHIKAGLRPELIYAHLKTGGLLATTENWDKLLPEDQEAWTEAIGEWEKLSREKQEAWAKTIREDPEARAALIREAANIARQFDRDPGIQ